jgi:hypothetical protein
MISPTEMYVIYFLEFSTIGAVLYAMRETIAEKMWGVRFKKWVEIDTGRRGYTQLDKALNSCTIRGMKKAVNRANIKNGIMYFVSDCAENLKVEDAKEKYLFYMNSEEFDTVYKNKLLQTLMLSVQNNWLLIITVLCLITLVISGYTEYQISQQKTQIEWIVWKLNQTVIPAGT